MKLPGYSQLVLSITIGCALAVSVVSHGAENGTMTPFAVKESRSEHFVVSRYVLHGQTIQICFRSCEKGDRGKRFAGRAPYISRFYGPDIHDGDEIIRIQDELVADMNGLAGHMMEVGARKKSFSVEVRSPGSKEVRKITVFGVPYAVITLDEAKASTAEPKPVAP